MLCTLAEEIKKLLDVQARKFVGDFVSQIGFSPFSYVKKNKNKNQIINVFKFENWRSRTTFHRSYFSLG